MLNTVKYVKNPKSICFLKTWHIQCFHVVEIQLRAESHCHAFWKVITSICCYTYSLFKNAINQLMVHCWCGILGVSPSTNPFHKGLWTESKTPTNHWSSWIKVKVASIVLWHLLSFHTGNILIIPRSACSAYEFALNLRLKMLKMLKGKPVVHCKKILRTSYGCMKL